MHWNNITSGYLCWKRQIQALLLIFLLGTIYLLCLLHRCITAVTHDSVIIPGTPQCPSGGWQATEKNRSRAVPQRTYMQPVEFPVNYKGKQQILTCMLDIVAWKKTLNYYLKVDQFSNVSFSIIYGGHCCSYQLQSTTVVPYQTQLNHRIT